MILKEYFFDLSDLPDRREKLFRAMGYDLGSIPGEVRVMANEVLSAGAELCEIRGGYRIVDPVNLHRDHYSLDVDTISLRVGKTVFEQLEPAEKIAVFLCTAGSKISARATDLMNQGEVLKGYLYDVFGSVVVETGVDLIQQEIAQSMAGSGFRITNRYSPGYCDWRVFEQKKIFQLLPENFCGIELTDSCMMIPIKSVSGIIGIGRRVRFNPYTCDLCEMENCFYRK